MNRLYEPKSAVGEVLLNAYGRLGGGSSEEEDAWAEVTSGPEYPKTKRLIADLIKWKVPGADRLSDSFVALETESDAVFFSNYTVLLENFATLKTAAEAAHAKWKGYAELGTFVADSWTKVSDLYLAFKGIPPSWIELGLYREITSAEKNFMSAFSKPDYLAAHNALVVLQSHLRRFPDSVKDSLSNKKKLDDDYDVQKKRQDALENQVRKILEGPRAQEFLKDDANTAMLRMRLLHVRTVDRINRLPKEAAPDLEAWTRLIGLAEEGLQAFGKKGKSEDPEELLVELGAFTQVLPMPDEVSNKSLEAEHAVPPKNDTGHPTIEALKENVKKAYLALDASPDDKDEGPLFDEFNLAFDRLKSALDVLDVEAGPAAKLAAARVTELAEIGLLPALNMQEKLELLTSLRGSSAPMAEGIMGDKLTDLGKAQLSLLGSLGIDEAFREVDRDRRKKIAGALVEDETERLAFKRAQGAWDTMSEPVRLGMCRKIVQVQCDVLGIERCPVELGKGQQATAGWLDPDDRKIFINNEQTSSFHFSFENVTDTLFHETSHWWQLLMVEAFNRGEIAKRTIDDQPNPDYLQIKLFALNDRSAHPGAYVNSSLGGSEYKKQPMEAHAYEVGAETQQLFLQALLK